jgi:glycosyltransferase involved in cell wall biosynthesis
MRLTIVTINYGDFLPAIKTINSVSNQNMACFEHLIIASGVSLDDAHKLESEFSAPYRKFVFNKDTSLYNAMNIGLKKASGDGVLFLNGGDEFYTRESISTIQKKWKPNICLAFRTLQSYGADMYIRPGLRHLNDLLKRPGHQGFIAPTNRHKIFYNENKTINADGLWMKQNINKYGALVFPDILSCFELGGISNRASIKQSMQLFLSDGIKKGMIEIIKTLLRASIGTRSYYKLLAVMRFYDNVR